MPRFLLISGDRTFFITVKKSMKINHPEWKKIYRGTISLCMINLNQASFLERCLSHHAPICDEIIVVDTGSSDNSIEIAKKHGALVIQDPWQDDFSRPRNISINNATSDWILILDPDEIIAQKDFLRVIDLTRHLQYAAFQLTTRNYAFTPHNSRYQPNPKDCPEAGKYPGYHPSTKTRFIQRRYNLHFQKCWHELLDYDLVEKNLPRAKSGIPVHHYPGEAVQKTPREKQEFYLRLGEKKVTQNPNDAQAWWELSVAEAIIGYRERAIKSIEKSFDLGFPNAQRLLTYYRCLKMQGYQEKAKLVFEKALCCLWPDLTHAVDWKKNWLAKTPQKRINSKASAPHVPSNS